MQTRSQKRRRAQRETLLDEVLPVAALRSLVLSYDLLMFAQQTKMMTKCPAKACSMAKADSECIELLSMQEYMKCHPLIPLTNKELEQLIQEEQWLFLDLWYTQCVLQFMSTVVHAVQTQNWHFIDLPSSTEEPLDLNRLIDHFGLESGASSWHRYHTLRSGITDNWRKKSCICIAYVAKHGEKIPHQSHSVQYQDRLSCYMYKVTHPGTPDRLQCYIEFI